MPEFALLVSPRAEAAYFAQVLDVARAELLASGFDGELRRAGTLAFFHVVADEVDLARLLRLSFVQGVFAVQDGAMVPLDQGPGFALHPDFVWGEKYRGKTSEVLTQLLINLGLQQCPGAQSLLDPMAGRGTTLLWAMRYGLRAFGIEQDGAVLGDMRRGLKKWSKLHRQKHKLSDGWVQKANRAGQGKFLEFSAAGTGFQMIVGDSAQAPDLLQRRKVDLIATDIPYGVQHVGKGRARNPLEILRACAPAWAACLNPGGVMAIAFNANLPKRDAMEAVFELPGLTVVPLDVAHRMSESILRDVLVVRRD